MPLCSAHKLLVIPRVHIVIITTKYFPKGSLLKMGSYSSIKMYQYCDNRLIY